MSLVKSIENEAHFQTELTTAGTKLVITDFTASWCGPCQKISPIFQQLSIKYPKAIFLKVDIDKCMETASAQGVQAMPTFIFYRNKTKIDLMQGADAEGLERKIVQHYDEAGVAAAAGEEAVSGHMDLQPFISKAQCECLNMKDDHTLEDCLTSNEGYLQSDCDEQLIICITFNQSVKIHSIKIKAPKDKGPRNIRLFTNLPRTLDFDQCSTYTSVQDLALTPKDLEGNPINLRFVKFQNVQNMQIFIKDNQAGDEVSIIQQLRFIGTPRNTTNMGDFKRVAGKKGESH